MITLRDYQSHILHNVSNSMKQGFKRILVRLATGGGKTACFAEMARRTQNNQKTVWFLVHRRELKEQAIETFESFNIPRRTIHIGMIGRDAKKFPAPDLIVFDECHHAVARTWLNLIGQHPGVYIVGLTATPARLDGKPLGQVFETMVSGPEMDELIRQKWLSDYRYITSEISLTGVGQRMGDYNLSEASELLMERRVYGDVIDTYREHADGKQAIYFCSSIAHSETMAAEFRQVGIQAEHFDGTTPDKQRREVVRKFRTGEIQILTNVDLIGEGFDMPACDCVGMLRPTQSLTIFLQQSGRALRYAPGKTAVLIDHVGNLNRHGTPSDVRQWSLTETVKTGRPMNDEGKFMIRRCPECFAVYSVTRGTCPVCGEVYQPEPVEIKQMEETKMAELDRQKWEAEQRYLRSADAVKEARNYSDFCRIAKARGYKVGWAYYRAKAAGMWVPY